MTPLSFSALCLIPLLFLKSPPLSLHELGVFVNPESPSAKAKLRLLYEVAPIAYLVEKAGGKSSNGEQSCLNLVVKKTEDRTQVYSGSSGGW